MRYESRHARSDSAPAPRRGRIAVIVIAAALVLALAVGGTIAWLTTGTTGLVNTFIPSSVSCEVTEDFSGNIKSNVNVKNTGDIDAYVRVKLVSYRTNKSGQHIGGPAPLSFDPGSGWVKSGDYYYYTSPVAPGQKPASNLIGSITLAAYTDADGGYQAIDVIAEAIQSEPTDAVRAAWGFGPGSANS